MIIAGLTFYVLAAVAVAAGFMVIAARNPVHSVLFLILAFFSSSGLFVFHRYGTSSSIFRAISRSQRSPFASNFSLL